MKKIIFIGSFLLILSGCMPANTGRTTQVTPTPTQTTNTNPTPEQGTPTVNPNPAPEQGTPATNPSSTPEKVCSAGQYSCACATGSYCLRMGAMCLSPSSPCPAQPITYLVSAESPDKYCNGANMDSEGFRKTITTEKTAANPDVNPTQIQQIKSIINLATTGMCQTALGQLDISVNNGTVTIPPMDGWAGISITMCSCKPEVEVNLLRMPGITNVIWQ